MFHIYISSKCNLVNSNHLKTTEKQPSTKLIKRRFEKFKLNIFRLDNRMVSCMFPMFMIGIRHLTLPITHVT